MKRSIITSFLLILACYVFAQQKVVSGEYFWDSDPGVGNGTSFSFSSPADSVNQDLEFNTTSLTHGVHRLMIRTKNGFGLMVSNNKQSCFYLQ